MVSGWAAGVLGGVQRDDELPDPAAMRRGA